MNPIEAKQHDAASEAMRRVGNLLLLWGQLETRIAYGIHRLTPEAERNNIKPDSVARTLTAMLKDWVSVHKATGKGTDKTHMAQVNILRAKIKDAAEMRNTICHGLSSIVLGASPPSATLCCHVKYHHNRMVHGTMKQAFYDLPRLGDELARLESFIGRIRDLDYSVEATPPP
jgi:hypothetical protein